MQNLSRPVLLLTAVLLGLLAPPPLQAARVENIFSAEVSVEDASEEARSEGVKEALARVLVRITGSRQAPLQPELFEIGDEADTYVQAYRYRRDGRELRLSVTFDGAALQARVARAGVPVWGVERPEILVWLAVDSGGGRRSIVAADSESTVAQAIREAALERGLPVSLPLMDAQDRERVSFADIWGNFSEAVEAASSRYAPDAILVGRARRLASGRLSVDWRLEFGAELLSERGDFASGIEIAADYFARQFAIGGNAGEGQIVTLQVTDLVDLQTYARVLEHLGSLSVIDQLSLSRVNGSYGLFELRLRGSREQLRRALALGDVLQERPPDPMPDSSDLLADLSYRPLP